MTTQDIKDLVATKIAGQGTNVDAGSALPDIINGLCDIINNLPVPQELPIPVITENIGSGSSVELSEERYSELVSSSILLFGRSLYSIINPQGSGVSGYPSNAMVCTYFAHQLMVDDTYEANSFDVIIVFVEYDEDDDRERYYIQLLSV